MEFIKTTLPPDTEFYNNLLRYEDLMKNPVTKESQFIDNYDDMFAKIVGEAKFDSNGYFVDGNGIEGKMSSLVKSGKSINQLSGTVDAEFLKLPEYKGLPSRYLDPGEANQTSWDLTRWFNESGFSSFSSTARNIGGATTNLKFVIDWGI